MPAKLKMSKPEYIYINAKQMQVHKDTEKKIKIGDKNHEKVNGSTLILLTKGEKIKVKGLTKSKFLLISGKPIGEPIARGGPFVMNTKEEILKAMEDYQSGNFVQK